MMCTTPFDAMTSAMTMFAALLAPWTRSDNSMILPPCSVDLHFDGQSRKPAFRTVLGMIFSGILVIQTWDWPTSESLINTRWSGDHLLSHSRQIGEDQVPRLQPRRLLQGEGEGDAATCTQDEQKWVSLDSIDDRAGLTRAMGNVSLAYATCQRVI